MPAFVQSLFELRKYFHLVKMDEQNRMVRAGIGKKDGNWFARIDLWFAGIRISKS